jgi:Cu/Ag efflux pump CusA
MIGGIFSSFVMELIVYPPVYAIWKKHELKREAELAPAAEIP